MSVTAIFISNLPHGISETELKEQLVDHNSLVFDENSVQVSIYSSSRCNPVAVIKGIDCNFEKLLLDTRYLRIYHGEAATNCVIKPDAGDARQTDGKFQSRKTSLAKRQFIQRAGLPYKKMTEIFNFNFFKSINTISYETPTSQQDDRMLCIDTKSVNPKSFRLPGFNYMRQKGREGYVCVIYHSTLENIQAIAKLNLNRDLLQNPHGPLPQFISADGRVRATINIQRGLGIGGALIDVEGLSKRIGFIPFQEFNPAILNFPLLETIPSYCWRCKSEYQLLGINMHLSSIAGRCLCDYDAYRTGGYRWLDEKFTRLRLSHSEKNMNLEISHYPVKQVYKDAKEYESIMLPLLEEEWFSTSTRFTQVNSTAAIVLRNWWIETVVAEKGRTYNVYATKLSIPHHKAWTGNNEKCITRATLEWKGQKYKSKVCGMKLVRNEVHVVIRSKFLETYQPLEPEELVVVIPKQSKLEYTALKKMLQTWVERSTDDATPLLQVMLNPGNPPNNQTWKLLEDVVKPKINSFQNMVSRSRVLCKLNNGQLLAMKNAKEHAVSFIHGPPGTGKTFTVAAVAILLAIQEKGTVLICAPSNFAADGVAIALNKLIKELNSYIKVIRMFSRTRVQQLLQGDKAAEVEKMFVSLHQEMRKSSKWLNDPTIVDLPIIAKNVKNNTEYLLSEEQTTSLEAHESQIMWDVIESAHIVVCTVGCVTDDRLLSFAKAGVISTIILDEAGQLNHPSTLNIFNLNPKRMVFAGDNMQLTATVVSFSAAHAGLQMSLMDMIPQADEGEVDSNFPVPPPWTTLVEQYRMHPQIRQLVSNLTYEGKLRDAPSLSEKRCSYFDFILEAKMGGSRLGVLDHSAYERFDANQCGYYNNGEVEIIVEFIHYLMSKGVEEKNVTVITLYEAQKKKLLEKLPRFIEVRNADAYQGRENSIIIASFVRSSNKGDVGFLNSINRINVALSRAQDFLFVAWNYSFFKRCKIRHFVDLCSLLEKACVLSSANIKTMK